MYSLRFRGAYDPAIAQELDALLNALRTWITVDHNDDGTHNIRPSGFDFVPIGGILAWGTATAPEKWLLCDGSRVSRTVYQSLFEVIGTTYGVGDGSSTFNLPDLRQRFPLGKAASGTGATLGGTGGAIDHTHTFTSGSADASAGGLQHAAGAVSHQHAGTTAASNPPYLVVSYIILAGV